MMNVKKYRATTTREALEMIKQDLGENAFVLETRQIGSGGFLGLRSNMQVEVSAVASSPSLKTAGKDKMKTSIPSHRILNLTDDASAAPQPSHPITNEKRENIISALSARAVSTGDFKKEILTISKAPTNLPNAEEQKIDPVEISSEAPRFVHPKKEEARQFLPEQNTAIANNSENVPAVTSNRELELLRAELREVKFSLGAFANRQITCSWQNEVNLEDFGEIFDSPFYEIYVELTAAGISAELARKFVADIVPQYKNNPVKDKELLQITLLQAISSLITFAPDALLHGEPTTLAVIGATGVGKTTTVAKLAARVALYEHRRVELVTLDTYRIAAVEQLKTYAEIIGAGCHVVRSVFELDATLRRLPSDATVLIDTTGRSPHDLADQYEISDYLQKRTKIRKCLAIQATTHPTDASASIKKFEMYGADCLILTKMDETIRPGAVIQTIAESKLPLAYFCTGQRVPEDLKVAAAETFTDRILGTRL